MQSENTIAGLDEAIEQLRADIQSLEEARTVLVRQGATPSQARNNRDVPTQGNLQARVGNAVEEVLTEERPLHRGVILERILARGIPMDASNPLHYLGTFLTGDERFVPTTKAFGTNGRRGEWTLASDTAQTDIEQEREVVHDAEEPTT